MTGGGREKLFPRPREESSGKPKKAGAAARLVPAEGACAHAAAAADCTADCAADCAEIGNTVAESAVRRSIVSSGEAARNERCRRAFRNSSTLKARRSSASLHCLYT